MINGQRYTINIIVVLVLTFAMYAYLKYSKQGYEISVVGESENTARYAGINVSRVMIRTMLLSGAICGLCGFLVVAGKDQTISTTSAGGNGFTAIIVAWLAKFNTFYDADFFPADLPGPRRFGNCFCLFPERICSGYHHRHYPVLYPGQRIFSSTTAWSGAAIMMVRRASKYEQSDCMDPACHPVWHHHYVRRFGRDPDGKNLAT